MKALRQMTGEDRIGEFIRVYIKDLRKDTRLYRIFLRLKINNINKLYDFSIFSNNYDNKLPINAHTTRDLRFQYRLEKYNLYHHEQLEEFEFPDVSKNGYTRRPILGSKKGLLSLIVCHILKYNQLSSNSPNVCNRVTSDLLLKDLKSGVIIGENTEAKLIMMDERFIIRLTEYGKIKNK